METITTEYHSHMDCRRIPKSEMEKRRRDRINNSLETLRLLLLENTCNEKLNNPKVEKAEILESVVDFVKLEIESYSVKRKLSRDPTEEGSSPPCKRRHPYSKGMRSCLLRVGEFISTKSKPMENEERATGSPREGSPSPRASISCKDNSAPIHNTYVGDLTLSSLLAAHRSKNLDQNEAHHITKRFSSEQKCVAVDPVWRPWPQ
ncbi:unnamed protein product [Gadus morhua 'NCC']